jgi:hypothetical protein
VLLIIAVASALFHFANAPMLFMLGQQLALANPGLETVLTSAAVITGQLVTIPAALLIGARSAAGAASRSCLRRCWRCRWCSLRATTPSC